MLEYAVLDKDTIKIRTLPYLSVVKRGFTSKFDLLEMVNALLYQLRSGCRWQFLSPDYLFSGKPPSQNTAFQHYSKWCVRAEWRKAYANVVSQNKAAPDLSLSHIDGSHTPALRGMRWILGTQETQADKRTFIHRQSGCPSSHVRASGWKPYGPYDTRERMDEITQ